MKSIGGYLGFEIGPKINTLMDDKQLFNSGRAACLFYLKQRQLQDLWVPYYICGDFIDTLKQQGIRTTYYQIDQHFEIQDDIGPEASVLYVNYFGVKDAYIQTLSRKYKNLIIDNSQALFNEPVASLPTFYSVRKFIGVPDGGLLCTKDLMDTPQIPDSYSYAHCKHLLIQVDKDTESGYPDFQLNEKRIINAGMAKMSKLSGKIIDSLDLAFIQKVRSGNFAFLKRDIAAFNKLALEQDSLYTYPLWVSDGNNLRAYLREQKVFTPTLWADQLDVVEGQVERDLIENIVHLPIDQRYGKEEMNFMVSLIQDFYA